MVVVGGGVEGNFSVSFGPKPGFMLGIWTWTKLNNLNTSLMFESDPDIDTSSQPLP